MKSKHSRPHGTRNTPAMGNAFPSRILISLSGLSLLLLTGTSHGAGLTASDGAVGDQFGYSVSQSGSIGLVGAYQDDIGANTNQGSANIFRALDTATGTVTQNVKLTASDGAAEDEFGRAVSQSGSISLVGAHADDIGANYNQGSAYVFRGLDTATGAITQNVKLTASDGAASDIFGFSVSLSGSSGLVGAPESYKGSAYGFRSLDTATGTITQNVKLTASDGASGDLFGSSVSQSGSIGLVGATFGNGALADQGAAYVFRNLDTATGTITQNVKLIASDGAAFDYFGSSVSQSGSNALVGAFVDTIGANSGQGSAYVFRNLDTATGTITQNVKLIASDGAASDCFGSSVSLSGSIGLIGAYQDAFGANSEQGSAYVFRNLDTATGTITQNVKLTASDGGAYNSFGRSVSLDGDQFTIGAYYRNSGTGKAYSGSVSSVTTLDAGSTSKTISGISFTSQDDWIIGDTTDANQVTLSAGDTANVTASGKSVFIGKNAGSDNNTLIVAGTLTANQITIGAAGNTGNTLQIGTGSSTGTLSAASVITNNGSLIFNRSGTITQGTDFGSAAITGTGSVTQAGPGTTVFNAANSYAGGTTIKSGTIQVGADGSISHSAANIIIGNTSGDNGALVINGGSVTNAEGSIGINPGANGNATISSGTWANSGSLSVGYAGTGALFVTGGSVTNTYGVIGLGEGSNGSATITSGTWANSSALTVGNHATGTMLVNGGSVTNTIGYIGLGSDANGSATISSGTWANSEGLNIGYLGSGTMLVNGGSVTSNGGYLGFYAGSNGSATITSGTWASNSYYDVCLGLAGTGTMNLTGSGVVTVSSGTGTLSIAQNTGSTGTLNIGTGGTAGTLNAASVNGGSGTATVNFNQTGNLTFAPQLTGSLSVNKLGSGTTTLTGNNTYMGTTTVNAGALIVDNDGTTTHGTLGGGAVVNNGGTVAGGAGGSTSFLNAASAGSGSFTNNGGAADNASGGGTSFSGNSTAGSGTFTINGGSVGGANGGRTSFGDNASAGSGQFTTNGGAANGAFGGITIFGGTATAGSATVTTNGAVVAGGSGGLTYFTGYSIAGTGTFTTNALTFSSGGGGSTSFVDNSSADHGVFTINGSAGSGGSGAATAFGGNSTAAYGSFTANGGVGSNAGGGKIIFYGSSTAANGTFTVNGGTSSGLGSSLAISGDATGGTATIKVYGNGKFDISSHNAPGVIVGSVEGSGNIFLGSNQLTIGANDLSTTFSGVIQGAGGSLTKLGSGTTTLTGNNTYTGATTVSNGSLVINGAVASTSVVVDGTLSGSGLMANATLSGSGSINAGNSPGVMTAAATNPTGGLDYNFEFTVGNTQPTWNAPTASGNDVLRLTTPTPFTASLTAANAVSIYLNAGALTPGEVFTGGFYTDSNTAFLSSISSGTFTYLVANVGGAVLYNGTNYDVYSGPFSFSLATVSQSANFGAGVVSGYTTQFTVIPEPGTCTLLGLGLGTLLFRRKRGPRTVVTV